MKGKKQSVSIPAEDKQSEFMTVFLLCLCVTAVLFICHSFTGQWIWKAQPYNSYILQAQSWLEGRLDLGKNYEYLELAILNGKYYVSFPPFPSFIMLPFVACHWLNCDGFIAFAFSLAGSVYAYKIMRHFNINNKIAMFFALFLTVGSNWLMTSQNAWVWFIAQNMAFTLSLMSIYYALKNKAGLSLAMWACAVGCRPFQALYLPVLIYIIYKGTKGDGIVDVIKKKWKCLIPVAVIAIVYMVLNYARFGNPLEFGHNYLPEFMEAEKGQFNFDYIKTNLPSLFRLPAVADGKFQYPQFNGMNIFMVSPIWISVVGYLMYSIIKKGKFDKKLIIMSVTICVVELIVITAHKTMGGSHFGNRYTNDVLPLAFLILTVVFPKNKNYVSLNYPLFFMGFTLNVLGTVMYYMK